jgi:S-adenosylmethionine synthetase
VIVGVVASFQHAQTDELRAAVVQWLTSYKVADDVRIHVNPSGDWQIGGFDADAGLTGRKLAVDNYGPRIPVGGGAFSGKDPSKVDRSAAYAARKIAVDYLRQRQAREVFVRLAYAIGVAEPLEATVIIDGASEVITGYDLTPNGIITSLNLRRPIYEQTARYGHFGHDFDWES